MPVTADTGFVEAFPTFDFFYVTVEHGLPGDTHIMAWDADELTAHDATTGFNTLLGLSGALIDSQSKALLFGRAFAEAANAELTAVRVIVDSMDSSSLGETIADPTATAVLGGWQFTSQTWSMQNGILATWDVRFEASRVKTGAWVVNSMFTGPYQFTDEGAALRAEATITNTYSLTGHQVEAAVIRQSGTEPLVLPHAIDTSGFAPIPEARATNFDDSWWQVYYPEELLPTISPVDLEFAKDLADAGRDAYFAQVQRNPDNGVADPTGSCAPEDNTDNGSNWGFEARDPDCEPAIILDHPGSLRSIQRPAFVDYRFPNRQTTIIIHPLMPELVKRAGFFADPVLHTRDALADLVVGHEYFHVLTFDMDLCRGSTDTPECGPIGMVTEGMARLAETILQPAISFHPTSTWYATPHAESSAQGVNYLQRHPDIAMCFRAVTAGTPPVNLAHEPPDPDPTSEPLYIQSHSYDYGLYWGYLYSEGSLFSTIRAVLERIKWKQDPAHGGPITSSNCDQKVAEAVSEALVAETSLPTTHGEALAELGVRMHLKEFTWGSPGGSDYEWGTHLLDLRTTAQTENTTKTHNVGAWGVQAIPLDPDTGQYQVTYQLQGGTATDWIIRIVSDPAEPELDSETIVLAPGDTEPIDTNGKGYVLIEPVRNTYTDGSYTLTISQP